MAKPIINFVKADFDGITEELVNYLKTADNGTFKDVEFKSSNIRGLVEAISYVGAQFAFYANINANEVFLTTASQYKNVNKIAEALGYDPIGNTSSEVEVVVELQREYILSSEEVFFEIPSYTIFPSTKESVNGVKFNFTNPKPALVQVTQFGVTPLGQGDIRYTGAVIPNVALTANQINIPLSKKKSLYFKDFTTGSFSEDVVEETIFGNTDEFLLPNVEYSLLFINVSSEKSLYIQPKTESPVKNEICVFKINNAGEVLITRTSSRNKFYIGKIGFKNLEYTKFQAITVPNKPNQLQRLRFVIPSDSPAFQARINGENYTFSHKKEDIVIQSDIISEGAFETGKGDYNVILYLEDLKDANYGAKLLITLDEPVGDQVIIATIPVTPEAVTNSDYAGFANLKIDSQSAFTGGFQKTGSIYFSRGEVAKRVIFDKPYEFKSFVGKIIPNDSVEDYAVLLTAGGNVKVYWTDKKTDSFIIRLDANTDFQGEVFWKTISYNTSTATTKDISFNKAFKNNVASDYAVLLQPNLNLNVWTSNPTDLGFQIKSDVPFTGVIDYLLLPSSEVTEVTGRTDTGTILVTQGTTKVDVAFDTSFNDKEYSIILTPNAPIRVWYSNKGLNGFTINIEEGTGFSGSVSWTVDNTEMAGRITFEHDSDKEILPTLEYQDNLETVNVPSLIQGNPLISFVNERGIISRTVNDMNLNYIVDKDKTDVVSFEIRKSNVDYKHLRVFVFENNSKWVEWTEERLHSDPIDQYSRVFFVRINPKKKIQITFGLDNYGRNAVGEQVVIFGLDSIGEDGNILPEILSQSVVVSDKNNIFPTDTDGIGKQQELIKLVLNVSNSYFTNGKNNTKIMDSQGNSLNRDQFIIKQPHKGIGGSNIEDIESVRVNAKSAFLRQKRLVGNGDYESFIMERFNNFLLDATIFNFDSAKSLGLIDTSEDSKFWFNYLFVLAIPLVGEDLTLLQQKEILRSVNDVSNKFQTLEIEVLTPTFIPIDVIFRYRPKIGESSVDIETNLKKDIITFFDRRNRSLGETITSEQVKQAIDTSRLDVFEVMLQKDKNKNISPEDYDVDITTDQYVDKLASVTQTNLDSIMKKELSRLLSRDEKLVKLFNPLFDVQQEGGSRKWLFSQAINLEKFEMAVLDNIVPEIEI